MTGTPLFTLSRDDIYDYLRCPKIVAIKAYRTLTAPREEPKVESERPGLRQTIGAIGEAAAAAIFSPLAGALDAGGEEAKPRIATLVQHAGLKLAEIGVELDSEMQELLKTTMEGLAAIRRYLAQEYGELQIIGRGESRNGPMPGQALPDFVAIAPKENRPVLVEVKNAAHAAPGPDRFQASYYNTVARLVGVVVLEERLEGRRLTLIPQCVEDAVTETIVVYPRLARYERVTDTLDLQERTLEEVWRAKQLGYLGQAPHTECDSACPHHRLTRRVGLELPEGNLEVALPLPLIYAQGMVEHAVDLDARYLRHFLWRTGIGSALFETVLKLRQAEDPAAKKKRKQVVDLVHQKSGIPREIVERLFDRSPIPHPDDVLRTMASAVEPWEKILGQERIRQRINSVQGLATRLYTLPENSERFVKRSWERWQPK